MFVRTQSLLFFTLSFFASDLFAISATILPPKDQVVWIGNGAEPRELDPAISTGVPESHIIDNLFEGLTGLDPITLEPIPGVAESWTKSEDGRTYVFKIRADAKWSDGKSLTAEDFVWSWQRALRPETASEYSYQLYYIKNAEAFNTSKIKDQNKIGVHARGKNELVVELENPTPFFLQLTAFHTLYPVPRHTIEKFPGQKWTRPENMVSNGPFKLSEWKINQHIKLVPNENYWNHKLTKISAAYLYPIERQDTEERTFLSGKLHRTNEVPVLKIPLYEKRQKSNPTAYKPYRADPYLGIYFYRFNVTKPPFNDPRVRRAFALTIDRSLIAQKITRAGEQPAGTFTPPGTGGFTAPPLLNLRVTKKDVAEAQELLAKAGYKGGKGFPKVDILFNTSDKHKKIAVAIQQMWKKNLGVDVGLYNKEWKVYLNAEKKLDYQIARAAWIGDYPDPNTFLDMFVTDGGNNKTGWSNKTYDGLIQEASKILDQKLRYETLLKAEKILMDELPIVPIYVYTKPQLVAEQLKMIDNTGKLIEYTSNIQDRLFLKNMVLVK